MKIRQLVVVTAAFLATAAAQAAFVINLDIQPIFNTQSSNQDHGIFGSTWSFEITILEQTYSDIMGAPTVASTDVTLTISNASNPDFNGSYQLVSDEITAFHFIPNNGYNYFSLLLNSNLKSQEFSFGDFTVSSMVLAGPTANLPILPGEAVDISHFDGDLTMANLFTLTLNGVSVTYDIGPSLVTASVVPEPGTYALWASIGAFGLILLRRRR